MLFFVSRDGDGTRARIMAVVREKPGVHLSELSDRTRLAWSTVDYHMRVLARSGFVRIEKRERDCLVFPHDFPVNFQPWFGALRDEDTGRVLRHLMDAPGLGVPQLSEVLGQTPKVVRRHLMHLLDSGLVNRRGAVRPVFEPNMDAIRTLEDWQPTLVGRLP